ncbi:hypothetical protein BKA64DRAFT_711719 [Cadophora sp. MPI-SDFR-AT-0126]|nr:hypothetical protein BKA64DRAFT_711719 [Leotiomycetes sp. MPI-SDFR-AT-0126]
MTEGKRITKTRGRGDHELSVNLLIVRVSTSPTEDSRQMAPAGALGATALDIWLSYYGIRPSAVRYTGHFTKRVLLPDGIDVSRTPHNDVGYGEGEHQIGRGSDHHGTGAVVDDDVGLGGMNLGTHMRVEFVSDRMSNITDVWGSAISSYIRIVGVSGLFGLLLVRR